jgi:uncharacterized membrane protein YjjB (DUF3815 family)
MNKVEPYVNFAGLLLFAVCLLALLQPEDGRLAVMGALSLLVILVCTLFLVRR